MLRGCGWELNVSLIQVTNINITLGVAAWLSGNGVGRMDAGLINVEK